MTIELTPAQASAVAELGQGRVPVSLHPSRAPPLHPVT
jgi:hypothetical protein